MGSSIGLQGTSAEGELGANMEEAALKHLDELEREEQNAAVDAAVSSSSDAKPQNKDGDGDLTQSPPKRIGEPKHEEGNLTRMALTHPS